MIMTWSITFLANLNGCFPLNFFFYIIRLRVMIFRVQDNFNITGILIEMIEWLFFYCFSRLIPRLLRTFFIILGDILSGLYFLFSAMKYPPIHFCPNKINNCDAARTFGHEIAFAEWESIVVEIKVLGLSANNKFCQIYSLHSNFFKRISADVSWIVLSNFERFADGNGIEWETMSKNTNNIRRTYLVM